MESGPGSIDAEYQRRLQLHRAAVERHGRRYRLLARGRGLAVVVIVFAIVLTEKEVTRAPKLLALVPTVGCGILIVRWNRAAKLARRGAEATRFFDARLRCLSGRWPGCGVSGSQYLRPDHPAAADLDLFGAGSLFELLCTARTQLGQDTLASWLLDPASTGEVQNRQAAVAELRPRLDLLESVLVLASETPDDGRLRYLAGGVNTGTVLPRVAVAAAFGTPAFVVAAVAAKWFSGLSPGIILVALIAHLSVALRFRRFAGEVLEPAFRLRAALRPLGRLTSTIAQHRFDSTRLVGLVTATAGDNRGLRLALHRLYWLLGLEFPATILGARPQLALLVHGWERRWGKSVTTALRAVGEFEALNALAGRARENPLDPFPELDEDRPCFEAEGLGHPFLPADRCIANDLSLGANLRLLVVSGSNMSGKSTFLRSVGINAVLAMAGAPVRARRLRLSPVVVGATLRVADSLHEGRSRFFAEALRVRQLLDLATGPVRLLFLLDELFQGTNSTDRRTAAEAILHRLVDAGALGLVTTHDLALTEIADRLAPRAANVHFTDHREEGKVSFDYRLRPGVVPANNALDLLRMLGIDVG